MIITIYLISLGSTIDLVFPLFFEERLYLTQELLICTNPITNIAVPQQEDNELWLVISIY